MLSYLQHCHSAEKILAEWQVLNLYSCLYVLSYFKLLLKPLGNGYLVDMKEQVSLLVHFHLCRDVIGKDIALSP